MRRILSLASVLGLLATAAAQTDTPKPEEASAPKPDASVVQPPAAAPEPVVTPAPAPPAEAQPATPGVAGDKELRLNFRGVPLEMVLNYLSEAAGFVIVPEAEIRGKVDVWSNQPLTKEEAVDVLNSVLNKNGYAAIRNGRTLTIVSRDEAKRRDIPVISGNDPAGIPRTDEVVTQIIPVRYINAMQLTRDLQPLLPEKASLTANEGGNALVLTDTQTSIRRMTEIIRALDTSIASISAVRVYPLRFADAKELATIVKEVFQTPDSGQGGDVRARLQNFFRGGGFGGGGQGGGGGGGGAAGIGGSNTGRPGASRVTAVADERSNSLVVSAPDELIPTIEELVKSVDTNVEDVTELRVFRLKYSDPVEMSDLLTQLFPDDTRSEGNRTGVQFGGGGGPFGQGGRRGGNNNANAPSERARKQSRVVAVPDARTGSVVVTAARDLMGQIAQMVEQLDMDPAKRQKVFVYSLENADAQSVEEILRGLFENQTTSNTRTRNNQQNNNALNNRAINQQNQSGSTGLGTGFGQGGNVGQNR